MSAVKQRINKDRKSKGNSMSDEQCVLNCEDAKYFFEFPDEDIIRNLWLYSLGLDECDSSARVCDKHFSDNMLLTPNKLEELAIPDQNLPTATEKKKDSGQRVKKTTPPEKSAKRLTLHNSNVSYTRPVNKLINDSSKLLIDYELRVQGKYICDVIEVPEHVIVTTVPIPKVSGLTRSGLKNNKIAAALTKIPSSISIRKTTSTREAPLSPPNVCIEPILPEASKPVEPKLAVPTPVVPKLRSKPRPKPKQHKRSQVIEVDDNDDTLTSTPQIEFVYYMTGDANPQREREVQACIEKEIAEKSIQCDVQLDSDLAEMNLNPKLYWVEREALLSPAAITKYECLECGEVVSGGLPKMWHAYDHQQSCALCPQCGVMCANEDELIEHEKRAHHVNNWEIRKAERCPKLHCKKAFHSRKQLLLHIDDHLRGDVYKCDKCRRVFSSALKLRSHQKIFQNCLRQIWSRARRKNLTVPIEL